MTDAHKVRPYTRNQTGGKDGRALYPKPVARVGAHLVCARAFPPAVGARLRAIKPFAVGARLRAIQSRNRARARSYNCRIARETRAIIW